jgi:hypothetical protein
VCGGHDSLAHGQFVVSMILNLVDSMAGVYE